MADARAGRRRPFAAGWVPGAVAFAGPLALYASTLAPTVGLEDSGEFLVGAWHLGVVHASGYPLWCLIAHAFTWLPWGTVAERVHLSSAVCGAGTCWLVYLAAVRLFRSRGAALAGALGLGASAVLWSQSVVAEVYSLNALLSALLIWLAVRWREDRRRRWLYASAFVLGIGFTNHMLLALVGLPLFVWLLVVDAREVLHPRVLATGAVLLAAGLSLYLYLPLRAAAAPPLNVGDPVTVERFVAHLSRAAYKGPTEVGRSDSDGRDLALMTGEAWRGAVHAFGIPLAVLAVVGLVTWPRRLRDVLWLTVAIAVFNTLVLNVYMQAPHSPLWVYVHRVYYIPAHVVVGLWVAAGAAFLLRLGAMRGAAATALVSLGLGAAVAAAAWTSRLEADRSGDWNGRLLALDLLDSAPKGAGFAPFGDDVIYPVLYLRWVEGIRPDVHVLSREYGWRGEPYGAALVADPLTDRLRADVRGLAGLAAVPRGLAYELVPAAQAKEGDWASFVPLPGPPRELDFSRAEADFFLQSVQARYAIYHARLGAKRIAEGQSAEGLRELDRAEALDPGDPYLEVLLFRIYRDLDLREERRRPLLESALRNFDERLDPHTRRYYPVSRSDIEALLRSTA